MWALGLVTLGLCVTKRALPEWILRTTPPATADERLGQYKIGK